MESSQASVNYMQIRIAPFLNWSIIIIMDSSLDI